MLGKVIEKAAIGQNIIQMERYYHGGDPIVSCFVNDCLAKVKDVDRGGARYNWIMPSFVGIANLVDSFMTIKKLIFDDNKISFNELIKTIRDDFYGKEQLRVEILNSIPKYGNDIDEVDFLVREITEWIIEETGKHKTWRGDKFIPSLFCWVVHERFRGLTMASPDGRKKGFPLGDGAGAAQGREKNGPTAAVLSSTKWNHWPFIGGIAVNLKFSKKTFNDKTIIKIAGLIRTFFEQGRFEIQLNVINRDTLIDAKNNPERYNDLVVRVGGYSDFFVNLSPSMQEEVILRTEYSLYKKIMKEVWNETNLMGMIFDIQRFSVHDGPGIRTTIFLKGCNLRCLWCHNPESFISKPQLQLFIHNCIGCGKCFEVCSFKEHQMLNDKRIFLRDKCTGCGSCARSCFSQALTITSREMSVYDVINEIKKYIPFYANTSGGITFSGGEALLQRDFVLACLKECKMLDIHTVIDTAGNVSWETFKSVLPFTDMFLYDIKVLDDAKHLEFTGSGNKVIKSNLVKLADAGANIIVRIPAIPDINDICSDMKEISDFLNGIKGIRIVELLEFHSLVEGKYTSLGLEYKMKGFEKMLLEKMRQLAEVFIENRFETVF